MRLAFVLSGLGAGGAEKIISLLAQHRAELGDDVHVLAYGAIDPQSYFPYNSSVQVAVPTNGETSARNPALRIVKRARWLRRRIRAIQPDLVVSFLTKANVLVMAATRLLGVPVVLSERNNPKMQDAHSLWRVATRLLASRASAIVMQTEAAREWLPPHLRTAAVVIPNPCVIPREARAVDRNGLNVIAVGRLERQKGFDILIDAFARVVENVPEATLTIYGDGALRQALQQQAEVRGVAQRVSLPGITAAPGGWLMSGDIFVLSSRFEGFPNVLVEALAAGIPTIAADCPWGPATIIEDQRSGILVPTEDVDALAAALQRLLTDRNLREAFSQSGPSSVARFALSNVLAQWDDVLERGLGRSRLPKLERTATPID